MSDPLGLNDDFIERLTGVALPQSAPSTNFRESTDLDAVIGQATNTTIKPRRVLPPDAFEENIGVFGEFGRGVRAGVSRIGADLDATLGVAAGLTGASETSSELLQMALEEEQYIAARFPKQVQGIDDIDSAGDFVKWAARTLGEQVPVLASIVLGGGVGGIIGRLIGQGAVSTARGMALADKVGQGVGAYGTAGLFETGATALEQQGALGEVNNTTALAGGIVKGGLEAIVPQVIMRRFGLNARQSGQLLDRVFGMVDRVASTPLRAAAGAGSLGILEAATEIAQEATDIGIRGFVDDNYDVLGPNARSRLLEAGAAGFLTGGVLGGVGGALATENDPRMDVTENEVSEQSGDPTGVIKAFHGTLHHFSRFTLEAIGTGEGHQAFGWGLYFAERPGVARWYRDMPRKGSSPTNTAVELLNRNPDTKAVLAELHQQVNRSSDLAFVTEMLQVIDAIESGKIKRRLLTVRLAPSATEWLQWDQPYSKQSKQIKLALSKVKGWKEYWDKLDPKMREEMSGARIYNDLRGVFGGQRAASLALRDGGVPGLRYLDASSRSPTDKPTFNYVLFDPDEVVITEVDGKPIPHDPIDSDGTFVPKKLNTDGLVRMMERIGVRSGKTGLKSLQDDFDFLAKWGYNILQVAAKNKHVPGIQRHVQFIDMWHNATMHWKARADTRVKEWKTLGKRQSSRLSDFMFALERMDYLKTDEPARHPTDEEIGKLAVRYGLHESGVSVYRKVKDDFIAVLDKIEELLIQDIERTFTEEKSAIKKELEISNTKKTIRELRARPYFPHTGFGNHTVIAKNNKGTTTYMEMFDTRRQARASVQRIRQRNPDTTISVSMLPKEAAPFRGLPPIFLELLKKKLVLDETQTKALDDLIIGMSPSHGFRKQFARRKNIPGFSMDGQRTYATYFWHAANFMSKLEFKDQLQRNLTDMEAEVRDFNKEGYDTTKRVQLIDYFQDHLNTTMNPGKDWAQLRSAAFVWWLGFSPASAALNFTQVPLVAVPYLSAHYGDLKTINAIKNSVLSTRKMYKGNHKDLTDEKLRAITRAVSEGFMDESQATELAATAEGGNLSRLLPGTKAQRALMSISHWSAFMFQHSEKLNRRWVFHAGRELALKDPDNKHLTELQKTHGLEYKDMRDQGWSDIEAKAYLSGKDAVRRTQFEYASWARPRFMRGRKGALFMFWMFTQGMMYFARYNPGRGRFFLMMLLAAGTMGLPGAEDLAGFAKWAARRFDKNFDVELELRQFVTELTDDPRAADMILHGVSREGFGIPAVADILGVPVPKFDMSASIGLGRIIPGMAEMGTPGLDFNERFSRTGTDVAGAAFGIGINLAKFLSDENLPVDDSKRLERAMPRAVRNVMRGFRYLERGREETTTGATILEFDANDPDELAETISQMLGFMPTRLTRTWDRERMQQETVMFWQVRRGMLLKQFDHATEIGDMEARADVLTAIRRFNNEAPFGGMRLKTKDLVASRKERLRRRRLREAGLPSQKIYRALARDVGSVYPQEEADDPLSGIEVEDVSRLR